MSKAYYIIDGDAIKGNALNVPYNGLYSRDFKDISMLDEATINLGKNIDEELKDCNPKIELTNNYFNVQYPFKKVEYKPFTTITNKNDNTSSLLDNLLMFSEERKYKVMNGESVKLDNNRDLDKFARYLLHSIFSLDREDRKVFLSYESIVSKRLKEVVNSKFNEYYSKSFEEFYNINRGVIISLFSSYTELRNIVIMLQLIKENRFDNNRSFLSAASFSAIDGAYEERPENILNELRNIRNGLTELSESTYYQYNLSDFFDMSTSNSLKI